MADINCRTLACELYRNTCRHMPEVLTLKLPLPLSGDSLAELLWAPQDDSDREELRFAWGYRMADLIRQAERGEYEDRLALAADQEIHTENWYRFDYFREETTRLLLVQDSDWKLITVRNCEDDYDTWVQIHFCSSTILPPGTGWAEIETCRLDYREVQTARMAPEVLIRHFPALLCADDAVALLRS